MFGRNDNNKFSLQEGIFTTHIGYSYELSTFLSLYENSCNIIYNSLQEKKMKSIDMASIPLIFLMRHSIEIGLKGQIPNLIILSSSNDLKKSLNGHSLKKLLDCFELHTKKCFERFTISDNTKKEFEEQIIFLREIVNLLHILDERGTSFRYPKGFDNKKNIDNQEKINLLNLKNNFDNSMNLLYFTDSVIYEYIKDKKELERIELELKSQK